MPRVKDPPVCDPSDTLDLFALILQRIDTDIEGMLDTSTTSNYN